MPFTIVLLALGIFFLPMTAFATGANNMAGSRFLEMFYDKTREQWEETIVKEIKAENVPSFNSRFVTVRVEGVDCKGKTHTLLYQASPDYLAIGTDDDFVRVPLTPMAAQLVAEHLHCMLPTKKMVDQIYEQAQIKLAPKPLTENRNALYTFVEHHKIIERQRTGKSLGKLVAGVKKDVVITNLLQQKENRVAIYGWHQLNGKPIQPLTTVHVNWYVDYSHGIRLIKRQAELDCKVCDLYEVVKDPDLCCLISDEGPITVPHY